jgi:aldehyde:ferredoxin oxidoreductase
MGVTYIADPTPGRHTAGSASWNETFGVKFGLPGGAPAGEVNVKWHGTEGKGRAQMHFSNQHQVVNGLGLCMFTYLTGFLPLTRLVTALTGWQVTDRDLMTVGERIQNLRQAFNLREGITPDCFAPHPRMLGQGDGNQPDGPLRGIQVPLLELRRDYYDAMGWNHRTGRLRRDRASALGMTDVLGEYVEATCASSRGPFAFTC